MAVRFTLTGEHLPYGELPSAEINNLVQSKITHEFVAETLDEVLPQIKAFLLGLQYNPEGDLEFVDNYASDTLGKPSSLNTEEPFEYKPYSRLEQNPVHAKDIKQTTTLGNTEKIV